MILLPHRVSDLAKLFADFQAAAASKEHALLGWPAFRSVMTKRLRVVDPILIKRLFDEFKEALASRMGRAHVNTSPYLLNICLSLRLTRARPKY